MIRLEVGEARGELRSREVDQISRLRRQLLMTPQARRLAGVAIPGDAHADPSAEPPPPPEVVASTDDDWRRVPSVDDVPNLDDVSLRHLDIDLFWTERAERDGDGPAYTRYRGDCPSPTHYAARAEMARRGIPLYFTNHPRPR
jgi:hypothetical protein